MLFTGITARHRVAPAGLAGPAGPTDTEERAA